MHAGAFAEKQAAARGFAGRKGSGHTPPEAKSRQRKPVDVAKIRALHNAGWSAAKIADELGCAVPTVYRHLERLRAENEESEETEKEESET
ncbi:helix-turn-helix domain-containing protein [Lentihominibacter sp.]|uniref:helix-turn-helix domain-containing protein n=1 Tax=Lentihominibacter sp. TaxID=2944216 RepID=UPI0039C6B8F0